MSEVSTVFLVFGAKSEDRVMWPVCAHDSEQAAIEHCVEAERSAEELAKLIEAGDLSDDVKINGERWDAWLMVNVPDAKSMRYFFLPVPVVVREDGDTLEKATTQTLAGARTEQLFRNESDTGVASSG